MASRDEIERAVTALNDASTQVATVWITLLSLGTYLAVTMGSTTHVDLLLERPIKLPLLGVELPLFTFYWAAPALWLAFHLWFLVQLYSLSGKAHAFNAMIATDIGGHDRQVLRNRLHVFMLTQALAGPERGAAPRWLLRLTMWLTAVGMPLAVLLIAQLRFLP